MKQLLNIEEWPRKDHFNFFKEFEEPFFGICASVDCSTAFKYSKDNNISFFLFYLYCSLRAANEITPFRYRINENNIFVYDQVNASPTINRPDGSFGFSYMDYEPDFNQFIEKAKLEIERIQNSKGLIPAVSGENVIHYSSIPWINFTSLSHARAFRFKDSSPKISFGKMTEENNRKKMPVSVHVHHALMDGYDVGRHFELFETLMNSDL
jgi:chloramphenicol O-acetyltransferase type A